LIQQVRLDRAKHLLLHTQLSITYVALMTGCGVVAALSFFLRKATGASPRDLPELDA
jgi:transcriptional regulator GlxA family with amidase domain